MGWTEFATISIRHKELYDLIKSCIFRNPNSEMSEEEWKNNDEYYNFYIDLEKFLGPEATLIHNNIKKKEEESINPLFIEAFRKEDKLYDIWHSNAFLYEWDDKTNSALFLVTGWKGFEREIFTFISKMYPNEIMTVDVDGDDDFDMRTKYVLVNGEWFDSKEEYYSTLKARKEKELIENKGK